MTNLRKRLRSLSPADRATYEALAEQFEAAWNDAAAPEPAIEPLLPAGPVRLLLLVHLVRCDLELRRARGQTRRVEDYCVRFPELADDADLLLELLLCEYELDGPGRRCIDEYVRRFPALDGPFRAALAEREPAEWLPPADYDVDPEPIGQGGWGIVYRGRHKRLDRLEAIKAADPRLSRGQAGKSMRARIQRLRAEIPVAARLNHPNIVHLYADGESNGYPYFAMEYCPGGSLKERLKQGPLTPHAAAALVRTLAVAVHHIHFFGLVHRDLKPSNVLFGEKDVPKIADFGLALPCAEQDTGGPRAVVGTPAYMAPEQVDSAFGPLTPAVDVYGLGTILYECLTGRPPFGGTRINEVLDQVVQASPPAPRALLPQIPHDLDAVCRKSLAKAPPQRYASALELANDLERFLAGAPVRGRRQRRLRLAWHWVKRNRTKALVLAFTLLAAVGVVIARDAVAARELQQAEERREHAEQLAESEKRERAAEHAREQAARIVAAREHARLGNWASAVPAYETAIRAGADDALRLRVERLVGYFALNRTAELAAELDALAAADLGVLAPQVKLLRAAWLQCDASRQQEGQRLARAARQDRDRLFTAADRFLADGLAADRIGSAARSFRLAYESDPFHYLAASCHVMALAALGQCEDCLRTAAVVRRHFPDSPLPDLAEAIVAFIDGQREDMKGKLASLASKLPHAQRPKVAPIQEYLLALTDLQDFAIKLGSGNDCGLADYVAAAGAMVKARSAGDLPNLEPLLLPVPSVGLYYARLLEIVMAYVEIGIPLRNGVATEAMFRSLQALNDDHPDEAIMLMMALVRLRLTVDPINRGELTTVRASLRSVSDLCAASVQAPSLVRRSPLPYLARGLGMIADLTQFKLDRHPDPIHLQRLRATLPALVSEGARWPKLRQVLIQFGVMTTVAPLTSAQAADWKLDTTEGQVQFRRRRHDIAGLCRYLVNDWAIDEPQQPSLQSLRARLSDYESSTGIMAVNAGPPKAGN